MNLSKLSITLSAAGLTAFASFIAHAGSDITVRGAIAPRACYVDIPGGADLDWGTIDWTSLDSKNFTTLEAKQISINIKCPDGNKVKNAIWFTDANPGSAQVGQNVGVRRAHGESNRIFGIGFDPGTSNKIGNFTLNPIKTIVDDYTNETSFGYRNTAGAHTGSPDIVEDMKKWAYNAAEDWGALDANKRPAEGNSFTWVFDVEPQINTSNNISSNILVPWTGTAQVNIRYY